MELPNLDRNARVFVAGHRGMVGSAIIRRLKRLGLANIVTASRSELDLRDQSAVNKWFAENECDQVYLAAGTVGGIMANSTRQAEFLYDNLTISANVIEAARVNEVGKLLYLGSSCIYPREAVQPISEASLLAGPLEPTNEGYAVAKIAGIKLCEFYRQQHGCDFISAMPTNLYGPNDNFDLASSHVLPALIRRFHEAKVSEASSVQLWGTGVAKREFLYVDDLADACVFLMANYSDSQHVNIGTGVDVSIKQLAETIREAIYPRCDIDWDRSKPDGVPRKLLEVGLLDRLGWVYKTKLADGVDLTYDWFERNQGNIRGMD